MGKRKRGEEKPKMEGEYDLPAKAMKAVHVEANKKRLIVVLHGAQMETVKVSSFQIHLTLFDNLFTLSGRKHF